MVPLLEVAQTVASAARLPGLVAGCTVTLTVELELAQVPPLEIVQVNWYVPATNPNTVVPGLVGLVKTTLDGPDTCVQVPVPELGVLPASVVELVLHNVCAGPALATVTGCKTVMVVMLEYSVAHTPLCTATLYWVVVVRLL